MPDDKEPIPKFAARIKAKHPEYKDVDDTLLVNKIVEKYPEYRDMVDFGPPTVVKKKESGFPKIGEMLGLTSKTASTDGQTVLSGDVKSIPGPEVIEEKEVEVDGNEDPLKAYMQPIRKQLGGKATNYLEAMRPKTGGESTAQKGTSKILKDKLDRDRTKQLQMDANAVSMIQTKKSQAEREMFPNAFTASQGLADYLISKGEDVAHDEILFTDKFDDKLPKNNETVGAAVKQINDYRKIVSDLQESGGSIEDAAINRMRKDSPNYNEKIAKILEGNKYDPSYKINIPEAERGRIVYDYLQNPNLEVAVANDPEAKEGLDNLRANFMKEYPDFAKTLVANKLSQERENRGKNNPILNIVGKEAMDKIAEDILTPEEKEIYAEKIRPDVRGNIDTPGFVENLATSVGEGLSGIKQTYKELSPQYSNPELLAESVEKGAKTVAVAPKSNLNTFGNITGRFAGMVIPIGYGGRLLQGLNVARSPQAANAMMTGLTFYGQEKAHARELMPKDELGQELYALGATSAYMMASNIFKDYKALDGLTKEIRPAIANIVKDFNAGTISKEAAKDLATTAFKEAANKTLEFGKETVKQNTKSAVEMTAVQFGKNMAEKVLAPESYNEGEHDKLLADTFIQTWLGTTPLGMSAAYSNVKQKPIIKDGLLAIANNPEPYREAVNLQSIVDPSYRNIQDKLSNIDFLVKTKEELDRIPGMKEGQKKSYLLQALNEKMITDTMPKEPTLEKKAKDLIKQSEINKEEILAGKDVDELPHEQKEAMPDDKLEKELLKVAPEGYKEHHKALKSEGKEAGWLDYMKDKAAENPDKFIQEFGDDLFDRMIEKVGTKKLENSLNYLQENIPEDANIPLLEQILQTRYDKKDKEVIEGSRRSKQPEATIKPQEVETIKEPVESPEPAKTGDTPAEPPAPIETTKPTAEGEEMRLTHADTEKIYKEKGLPERLETPTKHRDQLVKEADQALKKGYDFDKVADETLTGKHKWEDVDQELFARKVADLEAKQKGMDIKSPEFDKLQAQIEKLSRASDVAGTIGGRFLQSRKNYVPVEETLSDYVMREKESNKNAPLTDNQKEQVQKEFNEISETEKVLQQKIAGLEAENARLLAEQAVKKTSSTAKKTKKTHEDFVAERKEIFASIKDKLAKSRGQASSTLVPYAKELFEIAPDVAKLVKNLVEEGVTKLADVVKEVHGQLKDVIPDIQEKDVHDIIAGEYNPKKKSRNELATQLFDLKREAQLLNKLESLLKGEEPKSEKKKIRKNQDIEKIKQQIKDIQSFEKDVEAQKEAQAKSKAEGKETTEAELSKEEKKKTPKTAEQTVLEAYKTRTKKKVEELEYKLKTGDFDAEGATKKPLKLDKEAQELKDKLLKLKADREIRLMKQQYAEADFGRKALRFGDKALTSVRVIKSSFDVSMPFRQGLWAVARQSLAIPFKMKDGKIEFTNFHQQKQLAKEFKEMYQALGSEKVYRRIMSEIHESPRYELAEKSGLDLLNPESLNQNERLDAMGASLIEQVPMIGKSVPIGKDGKRIGGFVKKSERAATTFVNMTKWNIFNEFVDTFEKNGKTFENSPKDYEAAAVYANQAVGRGKLGPKLEKANEITSRIFFSLKLQASRLQLLTNIANPYFYARVPKEVRIAYWKDAAKFLALGLTTLTIAQSMGLKVGTNPLASGFGKAKDGDTEYDVWGGFSQWAVFLSRVAMGKTTNTSGATEDKNRVDILGRFARSKESPELGIFHNLVGGKDYLGQPTDVEKEALNSVIPLVASDIKKAYDDGGVQQALIAWILASHGVGVQNYDHKK